jgi:tRNA A-37 threonylcarbamoyl transferase component Bud32
MGISGFIGLLDYLSKQSKIIELNNSKYVVKSYASEHGILKWYLVALGNIPIQKFPFVHDPVKRMEREVSFMRRADCFSKPEIYIVDYKEVKIVRSFINGVVYGFNAPLNIHSLVARELGACHEAGWVLGDTKISNFIVGDGEVYIIDAEQAIDKYNHEFAAWDLLVLISTLSIDGYIESITTNRYGEVVKTILSSYLNEFREAGEVIKALSTSEFKLLAYILIPFPLNITYHRVISEFKNSK